MKIEKSQGQTPSERFLMDLCDKTFFKLWCYANPYKSDGKELCDLLGVFENHVFIFFDRESKIFNNPESNILLIWERWKREVIEKQIKTADGAKRYISQSPNQIFLDAKGTIPFPIKIPSDVQIHKIIVAQGAKEACEEFSDENVYGSLAVSYCDEPSKDYSFPFLIHLDRKEPVHVFDSHNLEIILSELDTIYDFTAYIIAKELAISQLDLLSYCGEEDLLAHYFNNYDSSERKYLIGTKDKGVNGISIGEGEWKYFVVSERYKLRRKANEASYLWDEIIQRTCQNALDGTLGGTGDIFNYTSAVNEMAMEPRFIRRFLSEAIINAPQKIPEQKHGFWRMLSFRHSFFEDKGYVFFLFKNFDMVVEHYDEYRLIRQKMLEIACGVAKNKFSSLKKIIGIAFDSTKFHEIISMDLLLLNCEIWTDEQKKRFVEENNKLNFFQSETMESGIVNTKDFPVRL